MRPRGHYCSVSWASQDHHICNKGHTVPALSSNNHRRRRCHRAIQPILLSLCIGRKETGEQLVPLFLLHLLSVVHLLLLVHVIDLSTSPQPKLFTSYRSPLPLSSCILSCILAFLLLPFYIFFLYFLHTYAHSTYTHYHLLLYLRFLHVYFRL